MIPPVASVISRAVRASNAVSKGYVILVRLKLVVGSAVAVSVAAVVWAAQGRQAQTAGTNRPAVSKQQVDRWMKENNNWGRWGKDDQLGAMNLVTEAKRKQALALAKTGTVTVDHQTLRASSGIQHAGCD